LNNYKNAFENGANVVEDTPLSTSKDPDVANSFADDVIRGNQKKVLFEINGNSGVDIENISAYGPSFNPANNESEILFKSGSEFKVVGYSEEVLPNGETYIKIILEQ